MPYRIPRRSQKVTFRRFFIGVFSSVILSFFLAQSAAAGQWDFFRKGQKWLKLPSEGPGKTIETPEYILYLPSTIESSQKYPLVIGLSPEADATSIIRTWKVVSEKRRWIVFASKTFSNQVPDMEKTLGGVMSHVESLFSRYPIDTYKIIATGLSGGAMGSHALAFLRPDLVRVLVINSGIIHEDYMKKMDDYPGTGRAVFLASPTDSRYGQIRKDRTFLNNLGWKTKWIDFEGGHTFAPASVYEEAATWLVEQFSS